MKEKTIVAISTPLGRGAISIVRLSGKESLTFAEKVFRSTKLDYKNITPRFLYLGDFDLGDGLIEKCMMVYFKAPFSYTGEDIIEFQVHGGTVLTQKILERLIGVGATLAEGGEFSKRAFENGKISLDEAESIIGEINAESESELSASLSVAGGKLKEEILSLQNSLSEQLAEIEATLDYPEEDFEETVKEKIFQGIERVSNSLDAILNQSKNARFLNNGINIALIGSPNAGKSSLLNAVLGRERAIVTDIAGTTRDTIKETIAYKGINLNFFDTAGIRETEDQIEKIGVDKSKEYLRSSDIVLHIVDGSKPLSQGDKEINSMLAGTNYIVVINKIDKPRIVERFENEIEVSALDKTNIKELLEKIYNKVITDEIDFNKLVVTNERQLSLITVGLGKAKIILDRQHESMDVVSMLIKDLWQTLGKITGQCENEEIIDLIFSKFCLGK